MSSDQTLKNKIGQISFIKVLTTACGKESLCSNPRTEVMTKSFLKNKCRKGCQKGPKQAVESKHNALLHPYNTLMCNSTTYSTFLTTSSATIPFGYLFLFHLL